MNAKHGILHDYDLLANAEPAASKATKCAGCDAEPPVFQWSDLHGEAMCTRCGCPYQLRGGGAEMEREGAYPYMTLRAELVEPLRAYYAETKRFTCLGQMLGHCPGIEEFADWLQENRPDVWAAVQK